MTNIRQLSPFEAHESVRDLAEVLLDCVGGGASVSFMASLTSIEAETFFEQVAREVGEGRRILLAAFNGAKAVGTVQLLTATPPNQPHRADVAKLLVSQSARGQGIGGKLVRAAEQAALGAGRTLLTLDTVTGDPAEKLYLKLGWTRVGVIPQYALYPDGRWCDTTIFYKQLKARPEQPIKTTATAPIS